MDRSTFFLHLRRSGLLSEQQIESAAVRFAAGNNARTLARALTAEGLLTRYQTRRLLAGKSGRLVLGPYRLLERIGQGGMARVFKAVHTTMDRIVALKVLLPNILTDSRVLTLFQREVRAAARLHHPHIVSAYDASQAKGLHFLVLEYVDGPNLHQLVKERGPLPIDLACDLMRQTAFALQYAHEKGMVHRDIKPANLLIAGVRDQESEGGASESPRTPHVKVLDFGLARLHSTTIGSASETIEVETGNVYGTPDYISPEQAHDIHAVDIRSDLYSLGCTFYYALSGQVPFPGNAMEKLLKHFMKEPQPLETLRLDVPAGVAALVQRLMAKDRGRRFQTPMELAEALAPWCDPAGPRTVRHAPHELPPAKKSVPCDGDAPTPQVFADPTASPPNPAVPLPPAPEAPALDPAPFRTNWRRWTALVEYCARGRGSHVRINPQAFRTLHRNLLEGCQALAAATEGEQRELYRGLEGLVRPWVNAEALARLDWELLFNLFQRCQDALRLLDPTAETAPEDLPQTIFGSIMARFKARQERQEFAAEMRRIFGVRL